MTCQARPSHWTRAQLAAIDDAVEVSISTDRGDGTPRRDVPIWVVTVGDGVYVRSYRGAAGAWLRQATSAGRARLTVAGHRYPIAVEPVDDGALNTRIGEAYQVKYARYGDGYIGPMIAEAAQAATLQLRPLEH